MKCLLIQIKQCYMSSASNKDCVTNTLFVVTSDMSSASNKDCVTNTLCVVISAMSSASNMDCVTTASYEERAARGAGSGVG